TGRMRQTSGLGRTVEIPVCDRRGAKLRVGERAVEQDDLSLIRIVRFDDQERRRLEPTRRQNLGHQAGGAEFCGQLGLKEVSNMRFTISHARPQTSGYPT